MDFCVHSKKFCHGRIFICTLHRGEDIYKFVSPRIRICNCGHATAEELEYHYLYQQVTHWYGGVAIGHCNILAYTVRFKERVTREPNFSSSQKRVSRDHSLSSSLKEKVSRDHSLNPSLKILVLCSPE